MKIVTEMTWVNEQNIIAKLLNNWDIFAAPEILTGYEQDKTVEWSLLMRNDDFQMGMLLA